MILIAAVAVFFSVVSGKVTVTMKDDGYEPKVLTVAKGTTVIFKNEDENQHWPASNFHPTHTLYPEEGGCISSKLDACKALKKGETFSFRFDILGQWQIHDHIFPSLTMTIEVNEKNNIWNRFFRFDLVSDESLKSIPEPPAFRALNYQDQEKIINQLSEIDPARSWQYLKDSFLVNGEVVGNAHEFAHIIGNSIYSKYGLDGIIECDATFAYGCYHGVSEEFLKKDGVSSVLKVQKRCIEIYPPQVSMNYTGCIHGMGHGLLTWEGLNVEKALMDCDILDTAYRNFCYDGVFMENSFISQKTDFDFKNVWDFCGNLDERYGYNCARYQAQVIMASVGSDIIAIEKGCDLAPKDIFRTACVESLGYFISQTARGNEEEIKKSCFSMANEENRNICVIAASRETIFQQYKDWEIISESLCANLKGKWKDDCIRSNNQVKSQYKRI